MNKIAIDLTNEIKNGISSIVFPLSVTKGTVWKEIPLNFLAAILVGIVANDQLIDSKGFCALTRTEGSVLISLFIIFLYYSISIARKIEGTSEHVPPRKWSLAKLFLFIVVGLGGLFVGAKWITEGAVLTTKAFRVSQYFKGLTIFTVGKLFPELAIALE